MNLYCYGKADFSANSTFHTTEDNSEQIFHKLVIFKNMNMTCNSDQHTQMDHESHTRELLPHTVLLTCCMTIKYNVLGQGNKLTSNTVLNVQR
jgi:hypothetical protein